MKRVLVLLMCAVFVGPQALYADATVKGAGAGDDPAYKKIEELTGLKGKLNEQEGVFKVSFPRADLEAIVAGAKLTPPMGLTAWAAFKMMGNHTVVMGDMVMTEEQVNPVMSVALENGLEVTALHNHFFWDAPRIMFMHIGGTGSPELLAAAVGKVFAKIKETRGDKRDTPYVEINPSQTTLKPATIEAVLGVKGELKDGVYKVTIGRTTSMHGHTMGNAMGVNTWAAFIGSDEHALVDGDFAMLESDVQPVLKALRSHAINVVAIHNHMTMENPRIIFLHYWAVGSTADLAQGLRAALNTQKR